MKTLPIIWQRLVDDQGKTCPRCQGTGDAVRRAVERLRTVLEPLGVQPVLECRELNQQAFLDQPSESNRIWIGGQPLEAWLEGQSYEVIPEELLVRAGLKAGIRLLEPEPNSQVAAGSGTRSNCCSGGDRCY